MLNNDYLSTVYGDKKKRTHYPELLAAWLCKKNSLSPGAKLLEVGCGRCEFLYGFKKQGLHVTGVDISPFAQKSAPDLDIHLADVSRERLPFADESYDIVYSKSFIEHMDNPEQYFEQAYRVLVPEGQCLTLVPDWESCYKIYFDDHTHKTPFTRVSLQLIYEMAGFKDIHVSRIRQLPLVWQYPVLEYISCAIAPFVPVRTRIPFLRWSRELMVLGIGKK